MKKAIIFVTAGLLLTGCSGHETPVHRNAIGLSLRAETAENSAYGLDVGDMVYQYDYMITESENGWYYQEWNNTAQLAVIMYADKETGIETALCPHPHCTHDGNTFCTASTRSYLHGAITYAPDGIYTLGIKYPDPERRTGDEHMYLLRYALDGSAIEELADFGICTHSNMRPLYHRGYIWVTVETSTGAVNPVTGGYIGTQWSIVGYELATGKTVTILETEPDEEAPLNNNGLTYPRRLYGDGDYLYFNLDPSVGWKYSPKMKPGLNRISLETGETEHIQQQRGIVQCGKTFYKLEGAERTLQIVDIESGARISLGEIPENILASKDGIVCEYDRGGNERAYRRYDYDGQLTGEAESKSGRLCAIRKGQIYWSLPDSDETKVAYCSLNDFFTKKPELQIAFTVKE